MNQIGHKDPWLWVVEGSLTFNFQACMWWLELWPFLLLLLSWKFPSFSFLSRKVIVLRSTLEPSEHLWAPPSSFEFILLFIVLMFMCSSSFFFNLLLLIKGCSSSFDPPIIKKSLVFLLLLSYCSCDGAPPPSILLLLFQIAPSSFS